MAQAAGLDGLASVSLLLLVLVTSPLAAPPAEGFSPPAARAPCQVMNAYLKQQSEGNNLTGASAEAPENEAQFVEAAGALSAGLYDFGLVMGTSASTGLSLLLEPGFVAQGGDGGSSDRTPLYFLQPNCSALSPEDAETLVQVRARVGAGEGRTMRTLLSSLAVCAGWGPGCGALPSSSCPCSAFWPRLPCHPACTLVPAWLLSSPASAGWPGHHQRHRQPCGLPGRPARLGAQHLPAERPGLLWLVRLQLHRARDPWPEDLPACDRRRAVRQQQHPVSGACVVCGHRECRRGRVGQLDAKQGTAPFVCGLRRLVLFVRRLQ